MADTLKFACVWGTEPGLRSFRVTIVVLALALLGFVATVFRPEYKVTFDDKDETVVFLNALAGQARFEEPYSYFAQTQELVRCIDLMESSIGALMGNFAQEAVATACQDLADAVLTTAPSFSLAHFVMAYADAKLGNVEEAASALAMAVQLAPNEGWQAARRLKLAFDLGPETVAEAAQQDALLVVQSSRYRFVLADIYTQYPEHRDWLTASLSGADGRDLRAFLGQIRNAAGSGIF